MNRVARAAYSALPLVTLAGVALAGERTITLPLNDVSRLELHHVTVTPVRYRDSPALEVRLTGQYRGPDTDTFAFIPGLDFHGGTIEVDVAGSVLPGSLSGARGFIGIAFRIDDAGGSFSSEGFYIRPMNGRAEDQVRRNHSTQYFSYPGYDFDRLRRESPGKYKSYADVVPGEWTHLRNRGGGRRCPILRWNGFPAGTHRPRPEARCRCAWFGGSLGRQRDRWSLPKSDH